MFLLFCVIWVSPLFFRSTALGSYTEVFSLENSKTMHIIKSGPPRDSLVKLYVSDYGSSSLFENENTDLALLISLCRVISTIGLQFNDYGIATIIESRTGIPQNCQKVYEFLLDSISYRGLTLDSTLLKDKQSVMIQTNSAQHINISLVVFHGGSPETANPQILFTFFTAFSLLGLYWLLINLKGGYKVNRGITTRFTIIILMKICTIGIDLFVSPTWVKQLLGTLFQNLQTATIYEVNLLISLGWGLLTFKPKRGDIIYIYFVVGYYVLSSNLYNCIPLIIDKMQGTAKMSNMLTLLENLQKVTPILFLTMLSTEIMIVYMIYYFSQESVLACRRMYNAVIRERDLTEYRRNPKIIWSMIIKTRTAFFIHYFFSSFLSVFQYDNGVLLWGLIEIPLFIFIGYTYRPFRLDTFLPRINTPADQITTSNGQNQDKTNLDAVLLIEPKEVIGVPQTIAISVPTIT